MVKEPNLTAEKTACQTVNGPAVRGSAECSNGHPSSFIAVDMLNENCGAESDGNTNGNGNTKNSESSPDAQEAIDRYYENNHYTVTGHYQKNQETFNKIPKSHLKALKDGGIRRRSSRAPSKSVCSKRSTASLPIPGANRNKFVSSFYWLAEKHKKLGFRHIALIAMVVVYNLIGAVLFYNVESVAERQTMKENIGKLENRIHEIALNLKSAVEAKKTEFKQERANNTDYFRKAYIEMLQSEDRYKYSTYYKDEDESHMQWTFASAYFFCANVYSTVGYGAIAPSTTLARSCVIVYGFIFIPLTLVVIRNLGQSMLYWTTKIYAILLLKWRSARGFETKEDEEITLPIKMSLAILAVYFIGLSVFVWLYDAANGPPGSGMSFFRAVYFIFITLVKVGLGDVMPNNVTYSPLISTITFLAMPIVMVINRASFIAIENGVFGLFTVIGNRAEAEKTKRVISPEDGKADIGINLEDGRRKDLDEAVCEEERANEFLNNFTVRSIATVMRSRSDVYGGDFGRVKMSRAEIFDKK